MIKMILELKHWVESQFCGFPEFTLIFEFKRKEDAYHMASMVNQVVVADCHQDPRCTIRQLAGIPIKFRWREEVRKIEAGEV